MEPESGGDDDGCMPTPRTTKKRKMKEQLPAASSLPDDKYKPYFKHEYKRSYPDNSSKEEFPIYVEGMNEKIGNKNPLYLSKFFKNVKGIVEKRRINANKIMVVFKQAVAANDFLSHSCLKENNLKAYIPAASVKRTGTIRFVDKESSNAELYEKLMADAEIIAVRRFTKKVGKEIVPLNTVSVTFVGTSLPQYVFLDKWRYRVYTYVPPLMQCFKCMKFRHNAKICRNDEICSRCSGAHSYKECTSDILKCCNCGGDHLAISKFCPIKIEQRKRHETNYLNRMYSTVISNKDFPVLPKAKTDKSLTFALKTMSTPVKKIENSHELPITASVSTVQTPITNSNTLTYDHLVKDDIFLQKIIKTLVMLANSNKTNTTTHIKDILIENLTK
ncbi:uncharacterized protein LOC123690586 [Pieris rapae]|uniref:uncharacterized protein LOC123690586 n=1 Tax=Pieris rapae TaxID=64459 RepID=UPI001E2808AB|nr:uncharacterized protein LOC123690586 [Pieris rapae]